MGFIFGLLGALIGVIIAIGIVISIIIFKVKGSIGASAYKELIGAMKNAKDLEKQEYARKKDVMGMTKLLEEPIQRDFPDFNKTVLFNLIEKNLTKIFNALENKTTGEIKKDQDLILIASKLEDEIIDIKNNHTELKYDNIKFHNHAIKKYEKKNGMATITTSSSIEYFYMSNLKKDKMFSDVKKQTRYTCEFAYIYDESKLGCNEQAFGVHCPNCGAPLKQLGPGNCEYCGMHVELINLKSWKMISYKEE